MSVIIVSLRYLKICSWFRNIITTSQKLNGRFSKETAQFKIKVLVFRWGSDTKKIWALNVQFSSRNRKIKIEQCSSKMKIVNPQKNGKNICLIQENPGSKTWKNINQKLVWSYQIWWLIPLCLYLQSKMMGWPASPNQTEMLSMDSFRSQVSSKWEKKNGLETTKPN